MGTNRHQTCCQLFSLSEELLSQGLNIMTDVPRLTFAFNQNKIVQDHQQQKGMIKLGTEHASVRA